MKTYTSVEHIGLLERCEYLGGAEGPAAMKRAL
jgi:hypothetical protein